MTKKSRKCRKTFVRASSSANKENSFSTIFCRKEDFRNRTTPAPVESAVRSCSFGKKSSKKKKEISSQRSSGSKNESETCKISSVSFFIPWDSDDQGSQEVKRGRIIDWPNLLIYHHKSAATLLYYPDEEVRRMYFFKPTVLPELKLKCRTVSESSTASEDDFIVFDDSFDYKAVMSDRNHATESDSENSDSEEDESSKRQKKVRFVDDSKLVTVHHIIAWDYAYRMARVSSWMTMALDAKRFKQRINSLEPILSPVLSAEHRTRIWETRMLRDDER